MSFTRFDIPLQSKLQLKFNKLQLILIRKSDLTIVKKKRQKGRKRKEEESEFWMQGTCAPMKNTTIIRYFVHFIFNGHILWMYAILWDFLFAIECELLFIKFSTCQSIWLKVDFYFCHSTLNKAKITGRWHSNNCNLHAKLDPNVRKCDYIQYNYII